MFQRALLLTVLLAVLPSPALSQQQSQRSPGDKMIENFLAAETDKLSKKFMDGARTLDEWKERLPRLKREYLDMLGLWPLPEKTPLKATVTGQVEAHGVVVEKIHFQSRPGLYVTANLYRLKEDSLSRKRPAIVYVCGHSGKGRDGNKTAFQDHGFWFANNGYVCIVLDTLQLGEIPGVHHGTYGRPWGHAKAWGETDPEKLKNHNRFWWHSAGYTPAGVECWNGVRAIDYLLTRPDVDPDKIGVTGISGGGAATFWIAAADERVKVAVPVSGMSDLEFYVKNKGVNGHCDCMFLYNAHQWDTTTIAALVAPRPMLFANSDKDSIFPMDGNRRIIAKLRDCYRMHGKPKLVDEYVSVGGHDYRPDLRVAIFSFFNIHLKGDSTTPIEDSAMYKPLPGKDLRVFPTDADLPKDAINAKIDELFVPRAKVALPEEGKFADWKQNMLKAVRARLKFVADVEPATLVKPRMAGAITFQTEPGVWADVLDGTGLGADVNQWALATQDKTPPSNRLLPGITVMPRGLVESWTKLSPPNFAERAQVLLGRTTDEGRLRDFLAIRRHYKKTGHKLDAQTIYGYGDAGVLAAYSLLFEPAVDELILHNPPKSHLEGPHFMSILRVLDIPEALGLLAPTPLTIIGGNDPAFDRTAEIYRLAGAADKLRRK